MAPRGVGERGRWRRPVEFSVIVAGLLVTVGLVAVVSWPALNDVTTGVTPEYPELTPLALRYSPGLVLSRAAETVEELDGWRLIALDEAEGLVRAESETALLGFVDDVTVQIEAHGDGALVRVRSRSRAGRADFGQNARNIERFQRALVANLELARRVP